MTDKGKDSNFKDENIFENDEIRIIKPSSKPKPSEEASSGFYEKHTEQKQDYADEAQEPSIKPSFQKVPREKSPYVTKTFLIAALVVVMILSSVISSFVAIKLTSSAHSFRNLSSSTLSSATGSKLSVSEIVAKNENSIVEISTKVSQYSMFGQTTIAEGAGSGIIVKENGYIVTNYHVIEGANAITVTLHNGTSHTASVVGYDANNDIAVIKISASKLDAVTIGDSDALNVGDMAVAIGNPLGQLGGTATAGIVSALERTLTINNTTLNLIQTDAAINPGNSGGGLFNGAGELIGVVVAKSSGTGIEGLAFAIPINNVAETIDDIITDGKIKDRPVIGITIADVTAEQASSNDLNGAGVYITEVTSPEAESAGLKVKDKVISMNGKTISSGSDLITRVRKCNIGDTVTLVIERDGKQQTIKTKLVASAN